jgi:hypothetical protein
MCKNLHFGWNTAQSQDFPAAIAGGRYTEFAFATDRPRSVNFTRNWPAHSIAFTINYFSLFDVPTLFTIGFFYGARPG